MRYIRHKTLNTTNIIKNQFKNTNLRGGMFRSTMRTQPNVKSTLQNTENLHFFTK